MKAKKITYAVRSWKRAKECFTHEYLPETVYVVAESQAEEYRKYNKPVWVCPDSAQGNISRVSNWIIDNCPTRWLIITDDDLSHFGHWEGNKLKKLTGPQAEEQLEICFMMAEELGTPFWGMNIIPDKGAYREYTPLSMNNYIGGGFQAFITDGFGFRYDEDLPLKEDYDMTLQVANKYRKILRFNFLHYNLKQHTNVGGCADYRTIEKEKEQFELILRKWGSRIVRKDTGASKVNRKKEITYDINPIIKVPLKGV